MWPATAPALRTGQPHHRRWRWTYNVDNSKVQYLGEGETKVETFVVKSVDGTEHTVTITITGVNDSAVIGGTDSGAVTEDETTRP
ncbi:VCBS domain-containing protein [Aeromonas hydrophila]|uniref:VCBS domain-containing protein n=1 Tax=Aeromonas hydrophila TaxID=644 RepID=UPI001582D8F4|nr:VCBS domain-containing protein [Aeromonas hydrophila]